MMVKANSAINPHNNNNLHKEFIWDDNLPNTSLKNVGFLQILILPPFYIGFSVYWGVVQFDGQHNISSK